MSPRRKTTPVDDIEPVAGAAGEHVWLDVIQKMDEVYQELLDYETALEEKNAELEESQQFIVSVLTSMSDLVIVCNRAGVIEEGNPSLQYLTGKTSEELKGSSLFELFGDEDSRGRMRQHILGHADANLHDKEFLLLTRDGQDMPVSLNCTPRFSGVGKMMGVVVTGRPVGELQRTYQALRATHEELKRTQQQLLHSEKMASLGRLVAGVAHELNNPISFVLGNVVALRKYLDRIEQYLQAVHATPLREDLVGMRKELRIDRILADLPSLIDGTVEGAERTRQVVDGLKRFSAIDRDKPQIFDCVPVIERAVQWVVKAAPQKLQLTLNLPEQANILGSAGQLQQVFINLVQNACDATDSRAEPQLDLNARIEEDVLRVVLRDNGPGIPPDNLSRIFDPFFTTKQVGKGTGLGLAISYGIVERHGGSLTVANAPEGGALFTLSLPLVGKRTA